MALRFCPRAAQRRRKLQRPPAGGDAVYRSLPAHRLDQMNKIKLPWTVWTAIVVMLVMQFCLVCNSLAVVDLLRRIELIAHRELQLRAMILKKLDEKTDERRSQDER